MCHIDQAPYPMIETPLITIIRDRNNNGNESLLLWQSSITILFQNKKIAIEKLHQSTPSSEH